MEITSRICLTLIATAPVFSLGARGSRDDKSAATQVAAKVDSEKIAVCHFNQVLARTNTAGATPEVIKKLRSFVEKQAVALISKGYLAINMGVS